MFRHNEFLITLKHGMSLRLPFLLLPFKHFFNSAFIFLACRKFRIDCNFPRTKPNGASRFLIKAIMSTITMLLTIQPCCQHDLVMQLALLTISYMVFSMTMAVLDLVNPEIGHILLVAKASIIWFYL